MGMLIQPSDLKYSYRECESGRDIPRFSGKPDPNPFDINDLYEVLAMLEAVMKELGSYDMRVLNLLEDILNTSHPKCISTREEVFDCLMEAAREWSDL